MENNRQEFKKRLKGLLGFILSLSIVVSMSGMNAYAAYYYLGDKAENFIFDVEYAENGSLTVSGGGFKLVKGSEYFTENVDKPIWDSTVGTFSGIPDGKVLKLVSGALYKNPSNNEITLPLSIEGLVDYPYIIAYHNYDGSVVKKGSIQKDKVSFASVEYLGFTNEGKLFNGWAETQGGSAIASSDHTFETEGTYDLYAVWKDYPYSITFIGANGTVVKGSNETRVEMLNISDPSVIKPGYKFEWWSQTDGGPEAYSPDQTAVDFYPQTSAAMTLYAVYSKKDTTIDTPGTYHLVPGKQYLMIGSYKVNGSSVSYAGGAFYVPVEGDYTFQ